MALAPLRGGSVRPSHRGNRARFHLGFIQAAPGVMRSGLGVCDAVDIPLVFRSGAIPNGRSKNRRLVGTPVSSATTVLAKRRRVDQAKPAVPESIRLLDEFLPPSGGNALRAWRPLAGSRCRNGGLVRPRRRTPDGATGFEPVGRGFESLRARQSILGASIDCGCSGRLICIPP